MNSTTPASVLPTVARQLQTVAYLSEQYSPSTRWTTDNWVSVATTYNPAGWDGFRNGKPLCKVSDAEAAITQARQDERERCEAADKALISVLFRELAAIVSQPDENFEKHTDYNNLPEVIRRVPAMAAICRIRNAMDARSRLIRGLTDGGNSK